MLKQLLERQPDFRGDAFQDCSLCYRTVFFGERQFVGYMILSKSGPERNTYLPLYDIVQEEKVPILCKKALTASGPLP